MKIMLLDTSLSLAYKKSQLNDFDKMRFYSDKTFLSGFPCRLVCKLCIQCNTILHFENSKCLPTFSQSRIRKME